MSWDFGWLWGALNSVIDIMTSWFSNIWTTVQSISNTGQGIFSGLIAFGTQLWDAFLKGMETIGSWIKQAFEWIYTGFKYVSDIFGQWFWNAVSWVGSGIGWIGEQFYNFGNWLYNGIYYLAGYISSGISWMGEQLYNFGNWLYNGMSYIANWIITGLTTVWNAISAWWGGVVTALGTWWTTMTNIVNTWWTNLMKSIRSKMKQSILASITLTMGWKAVEKVVHPTGLRDMGFGIMGIFSAPIAGAVFAEIVDALIPIPTTTTFPLIPSITMFSYSPSPVTVTPPTPPTSPTKGTWTPPTTEKTTPTKGTWNLPSGWFTGVSEITLDALAVSKDWTISSADKTPSSPFITYEAEVA